MCTNLGVGLLPTGSCAFGDCFLGFLVSLTCVLPVLALVLLICVTFDFVL